MLLPVFALATVWSTSSFILAPLAFLLNAEDRSLFFDDPSSFAVSSIFLSVVFR
jgi:hypothetical protein